MDTLENIGRDNLLHGIARTTTCEDDGESVVNVRRHKVPRYYRPDGSPAWKSETRRKASQ